MGLDLPLPSIKPFAEASPVQSFRDLFGYKRPYKIILHFTIYMQKNHFLSLIHTVKEMFIFCQIFFQIYAKKY